MKESQSHHRGADPHADQPVHRAGPSLAEARGGLVLVHGRGATAESILSLYQELGELPLAALAPQAGGSTWYPNSFLAPISANQPWLNSALKKLEAVVGEILAAGMPSHGIGLLGFSQGACLTLEFVARHPRRYGAVIGFTGGLIGPPGTPRNYAGELEGTPIFLGSGDPDPHVPFERVQETKGVLERMGAVVELRRYPGKPHGINQDERNTAQELLEKMISSGGRHPI